MSQGLGQGHYSYLFSVSCFSRIYIDWLVHFLHVDFGGLEYSSEAWKRGTTLEDRRDRK